MSSRLVSKSKFLSYILRHHPESIGLTLDSQGWADIDELIRTAKQAGQALDRTLLEGVVWENNKQRFALSADGSKIRANQGHSIEIDLALIPIEPPPILYHGTAKRFLTSIQAQGLLKGKRQHVHLSSDRLTATAVGKPHGQPIVLEVLAEEMYRSGYEFYRSANGVWLCDRVPIQFLVVPQF